MQTVTVKGVAIPAIGLGTWPMRGRECRQAVEDALELGYRHIDTAQMYDNEEEVGAALAASAIPRDEIFLTTKVLPDLTSAKRMPASVEKSLRKLGVDQVDLLLAHWPYPGIPAAETVNALSEMKRRGWTRHIGVSNYTIKLLDEAVRASPEPLLVNQIEYHALVDQSRLVAAIRRHGLAITAYSPIARGRLAGNPAVEAAAAAHGRSVAQIALRWLVQQGDVIVIPKSSKRERLATNLRIFDFALSDAEMADIGAIAGPRHLVNAPGWVDRWD